MVGGKNFRWILGCAAVVLIATVAGLWSQFFVRDDALIRSLDAYERGNLALALLWASEAQERRPWDRQAKDQRERVLARIAHSKRSALPPATSPTRAARHSLEAGRPDDALAELKTVLSAGPNPEASWLASRALLQKGDFVAAAAALKQAEEYKVGDPTAFEPAPFVGAGQCQSCHPKIFRAQRASGHGRSLLTGPDLAAVGFPERPFRDPDNPQVTYTFRRTAQSVVLDISAEGEVHRSTLLYGIGSGERGISFIGLDERDRARLERISLFAHTTTVDLTPSVPRHLSDLNAFLGRPLGIETLPTCLECHVTKLLKTDVPGRYRPLERGIGCERCHGPGGHHVVTMNEKFPDLAIARPRLASAEQILKLCGQCHKPSAGEPLPADDPAMIRQQALSIPMSRCYSASDGGMSCLTCHDPHRNAETNSAYYEQKCRDCHSATQTTRPKMAGAQGARRFRGVVCPVNADSDCLRCHMPKVEVPDEHAFYSDHHIRVHREARRAGGG